MYNLDNLEIEDIIRRLREGEEIPEDYKYKIFPVTQKEYEIVYAGKMRKEDILANEDGVFPVPLQVGKVLNNDQGEIDESWSNMLMFGDNLQLLKTIYENKDPLIKDKVKGKVKLIYIDPPFATASDFKANKGQKAYSDKVKGAEFLEFLRRRLIIAKEILAPDGVIYVHLDWKKAHYVKIIMDEVFGENYFQNEVIWCYGEAINSKKRWNRKHDVIYFYSNNENFTFNYKEVLEEYSQSNIKKYKYKDEVGRYRLMGRGLAGSPIKSKRDVSIEWEKTHPELVYRHYLKAGKLPVDYWNIPIINQSSKERIGYPTQKPEQLLERIIRSATNPGDIVFDFFAGSGTTITAAEKLGRRWIACDIGKLSFYSIQKRLLSIKDSKDLDDITKSYGKSAKKFITVNTGYYDLEKIFSLEKQEYKRFVLDLFEAEPLENKKINGITIDGEKSDGYYCMIFPYWEFRDASVDAGFLEDLHSFIRGRIGKRFYIIAPVNYVDFLSDYYEIGDVRYYFLKVPYHIIKELHKVKFKKIRQPQSLNNVNNLEDAIGFHFMRNPEVESEILINNDNVSIKINKFKSNFESEESGNKLDNFQSLSLVLIDKNFNGSEFIMDEFYFAEELLSDKKKKSKKNKSDIEQITQDETAASKEEQLDEIVQLDVTVIQQKLKEKKEIIISGLKKDECNSKIAITYVDIYGNEFSEVLEVR